MKKIITIVIISIITMTATYSQNPKTIVTQGIAKYEKRVTKYRIKIHLSLDQVDYSLLLQYKNKNDLRDKYFESTKKIGIDASRFTENHIEYLSYGYEKWGTILVFETTSEQEIKDILSIRIDGLVHNESEIEVSLDEKTYRACIKEAIKDAKNNAAMLAKESGKLVGEILKLESDSPYHTKPTWISASYLGAKSSNITLDVVFELL